MRASPSSPDSSSWDARLRPKKSRTTTRRSARPIPGVEPIVKMNEIMVTASRTLKIILKCRWKYRCIHEIILVKAAKARAPAYAGNDLIGARRLRDQFLDRLAEEGLLAQPPDGVGELTHHRVHRDEGVAGRVGARVVRRRLELEQRNAAQRPRGLVEHSRGVRAVRLGHRRHESQVDDPVQALV